jgi:hypothetical protein
VSFVVNFVTTEIAEVYTEEFGLEYVGRCLRPALYVTIPHSAGRSLTPGFPLRSLSRDLGAVDSPRLRYAGRPSLRQAAKRVKKFEIEHAKRQSPLEHPQKTNTSEKFEINPMPAAFGLNLFIGHKKSDTRLLTSDLKKIKTGFIKVFSLSGPG